MLFFIGPASLHKSLATLTLRSSATDLPCDLRQVTYLSLCFSNISLVYLAYVEYILLGIELFPIVHMHNTQHCEEL